MMKIKLITSVLFSFLFAPSFFAQDRTTVNATSTEISDNLDLRAVASIFGEAKNLEDFERQLNNPAMQISNLDLNNDNHVDYLRVVESVEGYTHLIVVQSVLGHDTFQDVATIEVERDRNNHVSVQVVGDVYMYGHNYIYEPVYVYSPVMYSSFWSANYRPYCSLYYWNYYPSYYQVWNPYPIYRYQNSITSYINYNNYYNYVTVRRSQCAIVLHNIRRANYCETQYPTRAFAYRNTAVGNQYELERTRNIRNASTSNQIANAAPLNPASGIRTAADTTRDYIPHPIDNPRINRSPVRNYSNTIGNLTATPPPIRNYNPATMQEITRTNAATTRNLNSPATYSNPENVQVNLGSNPITEIRRPRAETSARIDSGTSRPYSGNVANGRGSVIGRVDTPRVTQIRNIVQKQNDPTQNRSFANNAQQSGRR